MKPRDSKEKTERELLGEISDKLDKLIGLFATQGLPPEKRMCALKDLGLDWKLVGAAGGRSDDAARIFIKRRAKA